MSKPAIVVGVDGSEKAEKALLWYLSEIHRPESRVVLVHCEESFVPIFSMSGGTATADAYNRMLKESQSQSHQLEEKYKSILSDRQVEGKIISIFTTKPGEAIVHKATEEQAQMIVMGTRGMGVIRRTFLGSVSDYVVHHAHCPVLVCREPHMPEGGIEEAK